MRCFPLPQPIALSTSVDQCQTQHPIQQWLEQHQHTSFSLTVLQKSSLAKLIPLLLCGEQSAVHVFNTEHQRLTSSSQTDIAHEESLSQALTKLQEIEADERLHEQALQLILNQLPKDKQQHKIKRSAQQFYAGINQQSHSIIEHFSLIAQLDSCVCTLMNSVANSSISTTPLAELFHLIKKDEARHVSIARRHAKLLLQNTAPLASVQPILVQQQLVNLLSKHSDAFENLNINTMTLFQKLLKPLSL